MRIVADSRLRLPLTSKLVASAGETPLWIITVPDNDRDRLKALEDIGVTIIEVTANASGLPEMTEALSALAERGMTRILVEGGSHLQASLIKEGLADRLEWFRASSIIGGDGIPALQSIGLERISDAPELDLIEERRLGRDLLESYFLRN